MYYKVDITKIIKPKYLLCANFEVGQYFNNLYNGVKTRKMENVTTSL